MKVKRTSATENDAERLRKYKELICQKRAALWENGVQPIIDKVRNLSMDELENFRMEAIADWEVNPHFMNTTLLSSDGVQEEESQVIGSVRHTPADINPLNLAFIERFSGQRFESFEDAQAFMLKNAFNRPRPYHRPQEQREADRRMWKCEVTKINDSVKWSSEMEKRFEELR